ncbi:MAG: methionyl-tRNA formyltransferase, partial [Actinomycetota bacterium]|nr:methionyl-tRNA formyltransferase [Actinomycetota bacterium]
MRLLFAGTPPVALPSLTALMGSQHEVVGVLTRPDAPAGRGRRVAANPVAERARESGLPLLQPRSLRDPQAQAAIRSLKVDGAAVVAFGAMLPAELLDVPQLGWV